MYLTDKQQVSTNTIIERIIFTAENVISPFRSLTFLTVVLLIVTRLPGADSYQVTRLPDSY